MKIQFLFFQTLAICIPVFDFLQNLCLKKGCFEIAQHELAAETSHSALLVDTTASHSHANEGNVLSIASDENAVQKYSNEKAHSNSFILESRVGDEIISPNPLKTEKQSHSISDHNGVSNAVGRPVPALSESFPESKRILTKNNLVHESKPKALKGDSQTVKTRKNFNEVTKAYPPIIHLVDDLMIDRSFPKYWQALRFLGEGSYGVTFLVRDVDTRQIFAVKVLGPEKGVLLDSVQIKKEWQILNHKAVNLGAGPLQKIGTKYYLPMKYIEGVNWRDIYGSKKFSLEQHTIFAIDVMKILEKLHLAGIVHNDAAPRNIIIGYDMKPILIDYGLAEFSNIPILRIFDYAGFLRNLPTDVYDEMHFYKNALGDIGQDLS